MNGKKKKGLRVAVACGGTGGHIFPGLATAIELRKRGHDVTLWLAGKNVESSAVSGWDGAVCMVPAEGFPTHISAKGIKSAFKLICAVMKCRRAMKKSRPEVLLAMGSYASVGPCLAARSLGIPYVLHEANVIPGRAIKFLAAKASAVAAFFDETARYLKEVDITVTGMPLRPELVASAKKGEKIHNDAICVLVMGGSLGAHRVNELMTQALCGLWKTGTQLSVLHLTGTADETTVRDAYDKAGVPQDVKAFTNDMTSIYNRADFAVCRAGAASCAELCFFGLPALLIPYPYATNNHQMANAKAMEKCGMVDVVPESDLEIAWLEEYLTERLTDKQKMAAMHAAAAKRRSGDAALRLAKLVEHTGSAS